jgi:hypothetical protein
VNELQHVAGMRWRLVTTTTRPRHPVSEHTSSVVLARDEVADSLEVEAALMESAGWTVDRVVSDALGLVMIVARRGRRTRTVKARAFSPMDDA